MSGRDEELGLAELGNGAAKLRFDLTLLGSPLGMNVRLVGQDTGKRRAGSS